MSSYMSDLAVRATTTNKSKTDSTNKTDTSTPYTTAGKNPGSTSLDMDDFLQLIVAQFQNQDPENAADTTEMLNMMVQMTTIQSLNTVADASAMLYTSSLVGKEVTVAEVGKDGKIKEVVGTVTASGTYGGQPVIYVDGVLFSVSDIMAIGRLPEKADPKPEEKPDNGLPGIDDKEPDNGLPGIDEDPPAAGGE